MAATILSHASLSFPGQSDDSWIVVGSTVRIVVLDEELAIISVKKRSAAAMAPRLTTPAKIPNLTSEVCQGPIASARCTSEALILHAPSSTAQRRWRPSIGGDTAQNPPLGTLSDSVKSR